MCRALVVKGEEPVFRANLGAHERLGFIWELSHQQPFHFESFSLKALRTFCTEGQEGFEFS